MGQRLRISRRDLIRAGVGVATFLRLRPTFAMTGAADPRTAGYDAMLADFVKRLEPPGGALAVSKDGRLVYARGFGLADVEHRQAVEPNSLFRIASLSKPFTATAVMQLVQAGRLKLDDKVFRLLEIVPFLARNARVDPRIFEIT